MEAEINDYADESKDLEFQYIEVNDNFIECEESSKEIGKKKGRNRSCDILFGPLGQQFERDFLTEVFNRQCLYDYTLPTQERKESKVKENWLEIVEILRPRYGVLSVNQCIKIWRNCRNHYTRYKLQKTREENGEVLRKYFIEPPHIDILKQLDLITEKRWKPHVIYKSKPLKNSTGTEMSSSSYSSSTENVSKVTSSGPMSSIQFRKIAPKQLSDTNLKSVISSPRQDIFLELETPPISCPPSKKIISNVEHSVSSSFPIGFRKIVPRQLSLSAISSDVADGGCNVQTVSSQQSTTEPASQQAITKKTSANRAFSSVVETFIDNLPAEKKYDAQSFLLRAMQQYLEENNLFDFL